MTRPFGTLLEETEIRHDQQGGVDGHRLDAGLKAQVALETLRNEARLPGGLLSGREAH
jgi:hypothetical protein